MAPRNVLHALRCLSAALLSLPLLFIVGGCGGGGEPAPSAAGLPNLVLITVDTLRADHLGTYGYFRDTSPTIDALAKGALTFERCYAPIPRTAPSHTSLFTGVYPLEHGITSNVGRQLAAEIRRGQEEQPEARLQTFAVYLKERGYHTGGFVSATPLKRETGIAVGFDTFTQPEGHRRSAESTNEDVFAWLREVQPPFFLWVHYFDPHGPFDETFPVPERFRRLFAGDAPDAGLEAYLSERDFADAVSNKNYDAAATRSLVNTYDGAIRYLDTELASLFAELRHLGYWDGLSLVLTSDHGEGLGQHGFAGHGLVWNEQLRVPLVMRFPGVVPRRVDVPLSTIDVLPTFLGRLPPVIGPRFLVQARGRDVLANSFVPRPAFAMSPEGQGEQALIGERWKLLSRGSGEAELYDLSADPFELHDLSADDPERTAALLAELRASVAEQEAMGERYGAGQVVETTDPTLLEELKKLGYLGGDGEE